MAGIGFRLQRLLKDESYTGLSKAYLYAAFISCGPWLLAIFALFWIGVWGAATRQDLALFRTIVTYTFCGSLILTGIIQMGTSRYVADRLFVQDMGALAPCYRWTALVVVLAGGLVSGAFYIFAGLPPAHSVAAVVLFQAESLIWVGMIFLTAAKDYVAIVRAFLIGYGLTVGCAVVGGAHWGMAGLLWGTAAGQFVLAAMLGGRILVEFPAEQASNALVFLTWRKMPYLAAAGFLFNLGVWDDKIVFWIGPNGQSLHGFIRGDPRYDICSFLGYLTVVPAFALFLIRVETAFYKHYAAFFDSATKGGDLLALRQEKQRMLGAMRLSAGRLLKLQGIISLAFLLAAPQILSWLSLPADYVATFRLLILASLALVMLLILLIVLLYLDWQRETAWLCGFFALLNAVFAWGSQDLDPQLHGVGGLAACLVAIAVGVTVLNTRIEDLEFDTFSKQPIMQG